MYRLWILITTLFLYINSYNTFAKSTLFSATNSNLPKIPEFLTVGIIPIQGLPSQPQTRQQLQQWFTQAVIDSKRFRVINSDLVSSMWDSKNGRIELRKEFEVNGFIALSIIEQSDHVILRAHLLDSNMNALLVESDIYTREKFDQDFDDQGQEELENLIFRLINRLPLDIVVTSIQGPFITLSGGIDQSLQIGDQLSILRVRLKSLNPATKTWADFQSSPLGSARIIEVKNQSAIAKITQQMFDGAIEVGDGAKLPTIASRRKFVSQPPDNTLREPPAQSPIIVPSLLIEGSKQSDHQQKISQSEIEKNKKKEADIAIKDETDPSNHASELSVPPEESGTSSTPSSTGNEDPGEESIWNSFSQEATSHKILEAISFYAGPTWWSIKGPTTSSGKIPWYVFNHVGTKLTRTMFYNFKLTFGGGGFFGQTPHSGYVGYESFIQFYWEDDLSGAFLNYWRAGGSGTFSGLNISKGGYGGGDWIRGGLLGGVGGIIHLSDPAVRLDWFGDFLLFPLNIGRIGYDGSFKQVESSLGWLLQWGAYQLAPPGELQFGGMLSLGDERQTLKNGRRPQLKDYSIKALVRLAL